MQANVCIVRAQIVDQQYRVPRFLLDFFIFDEGYTKEPVSSILGQDRLQDVSGERGTLFAHVNTDVHTDMRVAVGSSVKIPL